MEQAGVKVVHQPRGPRGPYKKKEKDLNVSPNHRPSAPLIDPEFKKLNIAANQAYFTTPTNSPGRGTTVASLFSLDRAVNVAYHVHLLHDGNRIKPKDMLQPSRCPSLASLQGWLSIQIPGNLKIGKVKIMTAEGLVEVKEEEAWCALVLAVGKIDWMDGEVKILVELEDKTARPRGVPAIEARPTVSLAPRIEIDHPGLFMPR